MTEERARFERFGELLWGVLSSRGLNTLGKRELLLEIVHAASKSGLVDLSKHRLVLSRQLMASPTVVDGWLRDLYLQKDRSENWTFEKFLAWIESAECGAEDDFQKGLLVFQVTGAEQRIQSELVLASLNLPFDYKNNRNLLVIDTGKLMQSLLRSSKESAKPMLMTVLQGHTQASQALAAMNDALPVNWYKLLVDAAKETVADSLGQAKTSLLVQIFRKLQGQ